TKLATIYFRQDSFVVHPNSRTVDGVWMLVPPVVVLPVDCMDADLAQAVRDALLASREGVEHPVDWKPVEKPLLNAAGCSSWRRFVVGTTAAEVAEKEGRGSLLVLENRGVKQGFVDVHRIPLPESTMRGDELGARLREVLT